MCKAVGNEMCVLLVHPGGPLWESKDDGVWSVPKGLVDDPDDTYLDTAVREFEEETGFVLPDAVNFHPLGCTETKSKVIYAWAFHGDCNPAKIKSNTFHMEWPRGSGEEGEFEEVDRGDFFTMTDARRKLTPNQLPLIEALTPDILVDEACFCS